MAEYSKEQFLNLLKQLKVPTSLNYDFLFECFSDSIEGARDLVGSSPIIASLPINQVQLAIYLVSEHSFYLQSHPEAKLDELIKDEKYDQLIVSLSLDKYYTNEFFHSKTVPTPPNIIPKYRR